MFFPLFARCAFAAAAIIGSTAAAGDVFDLTVKATDLKEKTGKIRFALFSGKSGFPKEFAKADKVVEVAASEAKCTFKGLPPGNYAVVVHHDLDGDGRIAESAFGMPKEPIGLSNYKKIGPGNFPDFDRASIRLDANREASINLIRVGR